jgi:superfamily II RNA helicase
MFELSPFQKEAIQSIDSGFHTLVTAHTGSGKTLPAEHAIRHFTNLGKKVIYTSPIKALSNQKYAEFSSKFPELEIGILTGDNKHNPGADVIIMTTEILQNNLFRKKNAYLTIEMDIENELGCVIFDEVHYIDDADRGTVWDQCIIMLPKHVQMVMLSATIGEKERFAKWIETIKENKVVICSTNTRVVPLIHYLYFCVPPKMLEVMDPPTKKLFESKNNVLVSLENMEDVINKNNKCLHYLKSNDKSVNRKYVVNQLCDKMREKEMFPALFFVFSRKQVEELANDIMVPLFNEGEKDYEIEPICRQLLVSKVSNWKEYMMLPEYHHYLKLLHKGIGVHHAGMLPIFREMIEILYDKKYIHVLFATETFSIGLNMPTKTVCFTSLYKHDGNKNRLLYSHEFTQMCGRAGRRNIDNVGHVILLTNLYNQVDTSYYHKLLNSGPKVLKSKFKISYSLLLNSDNPKQNIEHSLMYQDILNEIMHADTSISDLKKIYDEYAPLLKIESVCRHYLNLKEDLSIAKNKIRKQILKEIQTIESEQPEFETQLSLYYKISDIKVDIQKHETYREYAQGYVDNQISAINNVLNENHFVDKKRDMAMAIHEIHPLVFSDMYEKYDGFKKHSYTDIFCLLSCMYDIKVPDERKEHMPAELKSELKYMSERMEYYNDQEVKYELCSSYTTIQYDMMKYIKQWLNGCTNETEAVQLIHEMKREKEWFTGDFIKCCLKLVNMAKELEDVCDLDFLEKIKEGSKLLKFVCTNESLYLC